MDMNLISTVFYVILGAVAIAVAYMIAFRIAFLTTVDPAGSVAFDEFILRCKHTNEELRTELKDLGWLAVVIRFSGTNESTIRENVELFADNLGCFRGWIRRLVASAVNIGFIGSLVGIISLGQGVELSFLSIALITTLIGSLIQTKGTLLSGFFAGNKTDILQQQVTQTREALQFRRERQYVSDLAKSKRTEEALAKSIANRALKSSQQAKSTKRVATNRSKTDELFATPPTLSLDDRSHQGEQNGVR